MEARPEVFVDGECAVLVVRGHHTLEHAQRCTAFLDEHAQQNPGGIHFVADMSEITGYSSEARKCWQTCFVKIHSTLRCVTIIGGTAMARMTAAAVCLYAGIEFRTAASIDEAIGRG